MKSNISNSSNSPLRYPGGKGKITRFISNIVEMNGLTGTYVEPFAGGAGVAINLLLSNKVNNVIINDLDSSVYAFWDSVLNSTNDLIKMIEEVPFDFYDSINKLTPSEKFSYWKSNQDRLNFYRKKDSTHGLNEAFHFFMANRMNVSGIIDGGPIGGKNQNGKYDITSRFNKKKLISKIEKISQQSNRILVKNMEATYFLNKYFEILDKDTLYFIDPPYFNQGKSLYSHFMTETLHRDISYILNDNNFVNKINWVLTYDTAPQIYELYKSGKNINKYKYEINYSANKRGKFSEFLFSSDNINIESFDDVELKKLEYHF